MGRGFLPERVKNLAEIKAQIAKLQDMVSGKTASDLEEIRKLGKSPEFAFYDTLEAPEERGPGQGIPPAEREAVTKNRSRGRLRGFQVMKTCPRSGRLDGCCR